MPASVRRAERACLAAMLFSLGAAAVPVASAGATEQRPLAPLAARAGPADEVTAAAAGAGWIARNLSSSGALVDAISHKPSAGDTAEAMLALVAVGEGGNQVRTATHWLERHFNSYVSAKGVDNPGALGLVILAAVAAGANPARFGGQANSDDLVARLQATEQLHGASAGVFGTTVAVNAFSQSLALLALVSVKDSGKAVSLGEAYLARLQCADGGWQYARATLGTPCAKPDPKTYSGPDTNSTALAVMAIVAAGGHFAHRPVAFFSESQEADGSFGYYGVSGDGQRGDPDSTGEVVQALIALHAINDRQFVRNAITPERALQSFQYRCGAPVSERGEFAYDGAPSQYATLQAVPAVAGVAFPISPRKLSAAEPRFSCGAG
ncbi:MAG: hypothetical protein WAV54_10335 [Acidimicrobiales bacterium]